MLDAYQDIRERIAEPPKWFDRHGVPRWHDPIPRNCSHVYADLVAFVQIECQQCGHEFLVEFATSYIDRLVWADRYKARLGEDPKPYDPTTLHYGDPPAGWCCAAGDTMNSVPRLLVAAWERDRGGDLGWKQTHENVPMIAPWDVPMIAPWEADDEPD